MNKTEDTSSSPDTATDSSSLTEDSLRRILDECLLREPTSRLCPITNEIIYEGPIVCVTLEDHTKLYRPQTLPEKYYTRLYDQITVCASNERETNEIASVETFRKAVLSTKDRNRSNSLRRWTLVDILQVDAARALQSDVE